MLFVLAIALLVFSCKTDWEKQQEFLLPSENKLESITNYINDMATINVYSVSGILNQENFVNYPTQKIKGKALKKWHKSSSQESEDLKMFFRDEPIDAEISKKILESIQKGTCYIAYMFNYNDRAPDLAKGYAHKNRNPIPGEKGYNTMSWIDMYFLEIDTKELIHISFGKF